MFILLSLLVGISFGMAMIACFHEYAWYATILYRRIFVHSFAPRLKYTRNVSTQTVVNSDSDSEDLPPVYG